MKALDDPEGRKRLAQLVVWGSGAHGLFLTRMDIQIRLEKVLERISRKLKAKQ